MNNFAEFVKAFCDFGLEMVELSVTTRWHLNQVPHHQCWWNFFWKNSRKSFTNEDTATILVKFTMILKIENIKNSGKGTAATSSDWVRSLCTRQVVEKAIFFSMKLENMFLDWNLSSRNFFPTQVDCPPSFFHQVLPSPPWLGFCSGKQRYCLLPGQPFPILSLISRNILKQKTPYSSGSLRQFFLLGEWSILLVEQPTAVSL